MSSMQQMCGAGSSARVQPDIKAFLLQGPERLSTPLHLQVSQASAAAREAVAAAGGSVTTVYYNKLGAPASLQLRMELLRSFSPDSTLAGAGRGAAGRQSLSPPSTTTNGVRSMCKEFGRSRYGFSERYCSGGSTCNRRPHDSTSITAITASHGKSSWLCWRRLWMSCCWRVGLNISLTAKSDLIMFLSPRAAGAAGPALLRQEVAAAGLLC